MSKEQIIKELKDDVQLNGHTVEQLMEKLEKKGYDEEGMKEILENVAKSIKQDMFYEAKRQQKNKEYAEGGMVGIFLVAGIPAIFDITSTPVIICTCILAGLIGFFCFRKGPIAGCVAGVISVILFNYTYHWYVAGRDRMIGIEILIPMVMAAVPAVIIYYVLNAILGKVNKPL